VFDSHADIGAAPGGPDGIFFCDTRYLSHLEMLLSGRQPLLLGSVVRDDNSFLTVDLTNPDIYLNQKLVQPKDMLHVVRTLFLLNAQFINACAYRTTATSPSTSGFRSPSLVTSPTCSRCAACAASVAVPQARRSAKPKWH
jgi:glycogen debranching enzyme